MGWWGCSVGYIFFLFLCYFLKRLQKSVATPSVHDTLFFIGIIFGVSEFYVPENFMEYLEHYWIHNVMFHFI
jgi:hypothetical protein